jgi:carbon monoxide dehydrogenase subunit G
MQLSNTRIVPAPPEAVFRALNDPEVLKACVPGCESLERIGDDAFQAQMTARIGPVSAKFSGKMTLADVDPPHGYTLRFEGQGGAAGFARGEARVRLDPADGGQTSMHYDVDAQVGGKLAQIGSRLVDGAAAKMADDFFARFTARFAPPATEAGAEPAAGAAEAAPSVRTDEEDASVPRRLAEKGAWTRFVAIAALVVILAWLYFRGRGVG